MKKMKSLYHGHRFPAVVISCAVRWYFRFNLSLRDIEELLLERGVVVTYEPIRCWCDKFGAAFARCVKTARGKPGSTWHLDEMFVTPRGEPYLLWRAVDEPGACWCKSVATRLRQSASSAGCCAQTQAAKDCHRPVAKLPGGESGYSRVRSRDACIRQSGCSREQPR
jgi:transposase-like protein